MQVLRENCVVLDTSILPKRPCISDIKSFMDDELQLDMSLVKSIQPHNVKNVVYLGMQDKQTAEMIAAAHHLKHCMVSDGKKYHIPIYVESTAADVRIHDLPTDMDNVVIVDHMRQYGEVIAIRSELWKSYFPGFINGVRILRMTLNRPIPSYVTVDDEVTLVTYKNQQKTCRNCDRKAHPKQRCSEAATAAVAVPVAQKHNTQTNQLKTRSNNDSNNNKTNKRNQQPSTPNDKQWPLLPKPTPDADQNNKNKTMMNKRQRSVDSDTTANQTKKVNVDEPTLESDSDCSLNTVSDICPYTQLPYKIPSFEWIEDEGKKRVLIEEYKQKVDALYLAQQKEGTQFS